uniref:glutaminase n=1 Tax=Tetraselmis sp. GSL018 TaxID=582737 RepID=A0A061R9B5_9CHLO|mmetsp:Transcript_2363/g.5583  ORF Transcript_2363/g.5583 Transcript_2363/m.5583 type:complete len:251 (+) Transcript_2363:102-854(+)
MSEISENPPVTIGVLALQGSFREHCKVLSSIPGVEAIEIRTDAQLKLIDGLIIPGGESTTMALIAQQWGLLPELQAFARTGKPIWGTCAGLIFLASSCIGQKKGGQALIGGLDVVVHRNFFGSQINSFETKLTCPSNFPEAPGFDGDFRAIFIRAPAIVQHGPEVEVLATYTLSEAERQQAGVDSVAVAVRQGVLMATAFHPEVTADPRWHLMFVEMVRGQAKRERRAAAAADGAVAAARGVRPADLPVY